MLLKRIEDIIWSEMKLASETGYQSIPSRMTLATTDSLCFTKPYGWDISDICLNVEIQGKVN